MTDNQHPSEQAVAVLGLPSLARALASSGVRVVTGETFRAAASATSAQLKIAVLPLILADIASPGTLPWVEKALRTCPAILLEVDLAASEARIAGNTATAARLAVPVLVDTILAAVGMNPLGDGSVLLADGSVSVGVPVTPTAQVDDDEDDWGLDDLDFPAAAPQAPDATAYSTPAPVPAYVAPAATVEVAPPAAPVVPPAPPVLAPPQIVAPAADFWGSLPPAGVPVTLPPPAPGFIAPAAGQWPTAPQVAEREPYVPARATVALEQIGVESTYSPTLGRNLAPVVITVGGKGGVGKTSIALALAQRAAVTGDLRVVLVDANRGQGDLRTYLSLNKSGLPTILDAAVSGDPSTAIITPDRLGANRPAGTEQLSFALVQAPPAGQSDPAIINAALYLDVITAARGVADLVVVDTQIVEGAERGLFDDLIVPMLFAHAFGLGISDLTLPGVDNLVTHLKEFIAQGVPVARLMTMLNRVPATTEFDLQKTSTALSQYGSFLASIPADNDIHRAMAYGASIQDNPVLSPLLDQVLMRVTGNPVFAYVPPTELPARKRGLFGMGRRS